MELDPNTLKIPFMEEISNYIIVIQKYISIFDKQQICQPIKLPQSPLVVTQSHSFYPTILILKSKKPKSRSADFTIQNRP